MDPKDRPGSSREEPQTPPERKREGAAPDIDEREEEGWSQPESSAQKEPPSGPGTA